MRKPSVQSQHRGLPMVTHGNWTNGTYKAWKNYLQYTLLQ